MEPDQESGSNWIERARLGSPEDLGKLLLECRSYLLLVANEELDRAMLAKGGASDVVQDTFLDAQKGFLTFRGKTEEEFKYWLRTILLRHIVNLRRRYRKATKRSIDREVSLDTSVEVDTRDLAIPSKDPSPSNSLMRREQLQQLKEALRQIPVAQASVIIMKHRDGLDFPEIAERLGKTEGAVRKLWARGIQAVQEEVRRKDPPKSA